MRNIRAIFGVGLLLVCGCGQNVAKLDERDKDRPLLQRAAAREREGDFAGAVKLYERALELEPDAVRGHLDVAIILHDRMFDYVGAIHHYRRYLALRPDSEKRKMVEDRIRVARQLFAAEALGPGGHQDRIKKLEQENATLRASAQRMAQRLAVLSGGGAATPPAVAQPAPVPGGGSAPAATPSIPAAPTVSGARPAQTAATVPPGPRTYSVKTGDTLSRIAQRMYGDGGRWKEIEAANRSVLGSSSQVRVGQVLTIP